MPPDDWMAQFQERLSALEQENTRLRNELHDCQRSLAFQVEVAELERANALWRAELIEEARQNEAIAKEREQAAIKRADELAKANVALARASERLADQPDLSAFLSHIALEAIAQLDADSAMISILDEPSQILRAVAHVEQGRITPDSTLAPEMSVDEASFVKILLETRKLRYFSLQQEAHLFWPGAIDFHYQRHHQAIIGVPLFVEGNFLGHLGLAFTHMNPIEEQDSELLYALAQQAALAIQLTRLAEEAKQAAIAREQEQAAQQRAAELAKANATLRRSLSWLAHEGNLNQFLERILLEIAATAQADLAYLFVLQEPERMLKLTARVIDGAISDRPTPTEPTIFLAPFPADITPAFRYMEEQNLFLTLDMALLQPEITEMMWPDAVDWHLREGRKQVASLVLKAGDRSVGFLGLGFCEAREFSQEERELVTALANQASLAILLIQLAEDAKQAAIAREQEQAAQQRAAELAKANESLRRSLAQLANDRSLNSFLEHILREAIQMLDGAIAQIFLYQPESDTLQSSIGVDRQAEILPAPGLMEGLPISQPFPANITGGWQRLITQRQAMYWDVERDADQFWPGTLEWHRSMGHHGVICVAMMMGNRPLGMLGLAFRDRTEFTTSDFEFFQALAQQAALAIQMTQLAQEAKLAAISEERNRIAREIHDTLAQAFTGISIHLNIAHRLTSSQPESARTLIEQATQLAHTGLAEARRSVWALHPDAEEYRDLVGSLSAVLQQMTSNTPLAAEMQVVGTPYTLPPDVGLNLLRIGQEALTNTLKYAQAQSIRMELQFKPASVSLRVQDDGCGFDPATTANGGFGLVGMQQRCQRINAQLTLNSLPGQGTVIMVEVPMVSDAAKAKGQQLEIPMSQTSPIRVLVVDDHPVVRQGLVTLLQLEHNIEAAAEASDGMEAVQQFRRHQPDVTLMDLQMPRMSGVEAIATICAEFPTARIVILTTYDGEEDIYRGLKAGARGYLLKDASFDKIIEAIQQVHTGQRYLPAAVSAKLPQYFPNF